MSNRVHGKVALITGAARGQGRAHAVAPAREGADIIAVDLCGPLPHVAYPSATRADLDGTVREVEKLDRRIVDVVYTTSKWAVRGMAKAVAAELSSSTVRVDRVDPGAIDTPRSAGRAEDGAGMGETPAALPDQRLIGMFLPMLPVQLIPAESVAESVQLLATDESRHDTAHEIAPDAGTSEY